MDRIDALRAYTRIVELGSFSAAARDLGLRQPTISKWIAALEDQLATQLLDRTTRTLRVTEPGQLFYQQAQALLAVWEGALADARGGPRELAGRLRVSAPVVFGERYVAPALPALLRQSPALELELELSDRYVDLASEGVDLAIRVGAPVDSSYRARTLASAPRRLVAAPRYLERCGVPASPAALSHHACLLHRGLDTHQTWVFTRAGRPHRARVSGRVAANNSAVLLTLARAGEGVALLASWLVDDAIARGELTTLLPEYELPPAPIQALLASTRHVHPRARLFIEALRGPLLAALSGDAS